MRIKQKDLIGKQPVICYTKPQSKDTIVIVQIFDDPKCVNLIKKVEDKVVERQCYPLDDEQYQAYIDSYNKYFGHSQVDGLHANSMANKYKKGLMNQFWKKVRNFLWTNA